MSLFAIEKDCNDFIETLPEQILEKIELKQISEYESLKSEDALLELFQIKIKVKHLIGNEKAAITNYTKSKFLTEASTLKTELDEMIKNIRSIGRSESNSVAQGLELVQTQYEKFLSQHEALMKQDAISFVEEIKTLNSSISLPENHKFATDDIQQIYTSIKDDIRILRHQRDDAKSVNLDSFFKNYIAIIDNIDLALKQGFGDDSLMNSLKIGLETYRVKTIQSLNKFGVKEIDALGKTLNTDLHEGIAIVPMPGKESKTIFDVMRSGYTFNGRLLRASQVAVVQ